MSATTRTQHPSSAERDAARRYLEHDHAAEHLSGQARAEANRHAQEIDEQHPRARDIAMTGTARELGELPKHLKTHQRTIRQRAKISTEQAAEIRSRYRAAPYQPPEQEEASSRRERAGELAQQGAGLAGSGASWVADTSWGETILDMFVWAAALSIGYLLITKVAAVGKLSEGASNAVRALVSPHIDPLAPGGHK